MTVGRRCAAAAEATRRIFARSGRRKCRAEAFSERTTSIRIPAIAEDRDRSVARSMRSFRFSWSIPTACRELCRMAADRASPSRGLRLHRRHDGPFSACASAANCSAFPDRSRNNWRGRLPRSRVVSLSVSASAAQGCDPCFLDKAARSYNGLSPAKSGKKQCFWM